MVVKYRPADRGTTLSIQRTYFEKDLTVSAISNIVSYQDTAYSANPQHRTSKRPRIKLVTGLHLQLIPCDTSTTTPTTPTIRSPRTGDSDISLCLQARTPSCRQSFQTGNSDVSLRLQARTSSSEDLTSRPSSHYNMLTYTEYYQSTPSPLGVGPAQDLAYQTIYDYFAEETATPILLGRLLDLFEPEAVGALGIFLTDTVGKAHLRLYNKGQGLWLPG
eukprot:jgi/Psemu1/55264/gm1.55264_g